MNLFKIVDYSIGFHIFHNFFLFPNSPFHCHRSRLPQTLKGFRNGFAQTLINMFEWGEFGGGSEIENFSETPPQGVFFYLVHEGHDKEFFCGVAIQKIEKERLPLENQCVEGEEERGGVVGGGGGFGGVGGGLAVADLGGQFGVVLGLLLLEEPD